MDNSIRNGIVFENILQYVDVKTALGLSAVCKRWYELINNDTVLWSRLVKLEQIEDPEYWYRADDNALWTLGTPCKPKNILLNYRKTYFLMKHNLYKKYEFICDEGVFEYDGKTLLFTRDNELHIYKIINNNIEPFQKIRTDVIDSVHTNSEFIVITNENNMVSYRLDDNEYFVYNQHSLDEIGRWWGIKRGELLISNVLIGMFSMGSNYSVTAWKILENRVIFNAADHEFLKYFKGIVYVYDRQTQKLVLYNEEFDIIYRINENFEHGIFDLVINDNLLNVFRFGPENDWISVSTFDKTTGRIRIESKSIFLDNHSLIRYQVLDVNNDLIIIGSTQDELYIDAYDGSTFQLQWSQRQADNSNHCLEFYTIFNKLLIVKENEQSRECIIEFRDVNNGNVLFTNNTDLYEYFWKFNNDMLIFSENKNTTVLLYR